MDKTMPALAIPFASTSSHIGYSGGFHEPGDGWQLLDSGYRTARQPSITRHP